MQITVDDVKHIASLSRIELKLHELQKFEKELQEVISHFDQLQKINTKGVQPSFHPFPLQDTMREDVVEQGFTQEQALANVKVHKNGYIKAPKVMG